MVTDLAVTKKEKQRTMLSKGDCTESKRIPTETHNSSWGRDTKDPIMCVPLWAQNNKATIFLELSDFFFSIPNRRKLYLPILTAHLKMKQIENRVIEWKSACSVMIPQVPLSHLVTEWRLGDLLPGKAPEKWHFGNKQFTACSPLGEAQQGTSTTYSQRNSNHFSEPHSLILMVCQWCEQALKEKLHHERQTNRTSKFGGYQNNRNQKNK